MKRVEAVAVMLDYLCQDQLNRLLVDMTKAANAADLLREGEGQKN